MRAVSSRVIRFESANRIAKGYGAEFALLLSILIWGLNYPILKSAFDTLHPFVVNVLRFTVATAVVGAVYAYQQRKNNRLFFAPLRREWRQVVGLGILVNVVVQLFWIMGLSLTAAGMAALLSASAPLWTAIVARVFRVERLGRLAWIGLAVAIVGTIIVLNPRGGMFTLTGSALYGNVAILVAAIITGVHTAMNRPVLERVSATALTFFGLAAALPFHYLVAIPYADWTSLTHLSPAVWGAVIFSGGLAIGLAPIAWNLAIKVLGPSTAGVYNSGVPVVALIASVLLLNEAVILLQVVGAALLLSGVFIVRHDLKRPPLPDEGPLVHPQHGDCPLTHACRLRVSPQSSDDTDN